MVALVKRLGGVRRAGHSGTLDPDATGVLPILLGRATRLAMFLTDSTKLYRADIEFGRATDTYDAAGETITEGDPSSLSLEGIELALKGFEGKIEQVPPMYSAIKHQGQPLYRLARAGVEVDRRPRQVEITSLDIKDWTPPVLTLEVECGKGTYIRSLAHDLGRKLGCGAHLRGLVRLRTGPFHLDDAITVEELEAGFRGETRPGFVQPMDVALLHLDQITVDAAGEDDVIHGRTVSPPKDQAIVHGEQRRVYAHDGRFLALVRFDEETGLWHPSKVFA